ncbi:MAG TPA: transcriptional repressor [Desulfobacteraceae bacterium]|nr:transcriptional repressor [Desulfobacteraceae bacterium]
MEKFAVYLKNNNLKYTSQRQIVADVFFTHQEHISAEDLYLRMKRKCPMIGFTTVYRTLNLLVAAGLAAAHQFKGAYTRFEPRRSADHHDHLICTACGRIIEFTNNRIEQLQQEVAGRHNFAVSDHTLEIFGTCDACRRP